MQVSSINGNTGESMFVCAEAPCWASGWAVWLRPVTGGWNQARSSESTGLLPRTQPGQARWLLTSLCLKLTGPHLPSLQWDPFPVHLQSLLLLFSSHPLSSSSLHVFSTSTFCPRVILSLFLLSNLVSLPSSLAHPLSDALHFTDSWSPLISDPRYICSHNTFPVQRQVVANSFFLRLRCCLQVRGLACLEALVNWRFILVRSAVLGSFWQVDSGKLMLLPSRAVFRTKYTINTLGETLKPAPRS